MDWKTLLDGVIGGVLGGIIGGVSAYMATGRQINAATAAAKAERLELRQDRSRAAALQLLHRLADIEPVLHFLRSGPPHQGQITSPQDPDGARRRAEGFEALRSLDRGRLTELPLVSNDLITKHYVTLYGLLGYFAVVPLEEAEVNRAELEAGRYLRWVRMLIAAYVAEKPPLMDVNPPVIVAGHVLDADDDWQPDPKPDGWA